MQETKNGKLAEMEKLFGIIPEEFLESDECKNEPRIQHILGNDRDKS